MKKIFLLTFTILILLTSCSLIKNKRLYFKYIKTANIEIEWFYYSYLTSYSPNYLIATQGEKTDTICVSNNIIDVNINIRDSIVLITFNGHPCLYGERININKNIGKYKIVCDTSSTYNLQYIKCFTKK